MQPSAELPLPHDLSPWGMFLSADLVVQAVMVGLALASVATWTVWLVKTVELHQARKRLGALAAGLDQSRSLVDAMRAVDGIQGPEAALVRAALAEIKLSAGGATDGLLARIESRLERLLAAEGLQLALGTGILASIGSVGPFVGLFGTVWGIMNSFIGISRSQTTNLAVVAPGIAEALLATALGLVAAIPAVLVYNALARAVAGHKARMVDASAHILRIVSRDVDRRLLPLHEAAE